MWPLLSLLLLLICDYRLVTIVLMTFVVDVVLVVIVATIDMCVSFFLAVSMVFVVDVVS